MTKPDRRRAVLAPHWAHLSDLVTMVNAMPSPEDPQAEAAYYAHARAVLEPLIATPATTLDEMRVKAEAYRWCVAGEIEPEPDAPTSTRVFASMMRDLLAA